MTAEPVLHDSIYKLRPEINAIIHVHDQLVLEYANEPGLPGTEEWQPGGSYKLVKEYIKLLAQLKGLKCAVIKDHGIISLGEVIDDVGRMGEDRYFQNRYMIEMNEPEKAEAVKL